ncbi:hypothetical protein CANMA_003946, partial [Candida margitis]|uniref:uncharacterized protein n=1 Tax=Candida margitis TaxID=1775924 RepID=UPI0022261382
MLEAPTIFFKLGGINDVVVNENVKILKSITEANEAANFKFARNKEEQEELFSARKNAFYAMINWGRNEIDEDVRIWVTDIAVPLSRLSHVLDKINGWIKNSPFESIILAHAGDGNFHADIFYRKEQRSEVEAIVNKMIQLGIDNDGTATGEHGIGNAKRRFLQLELGEDTIDMMRKIKLSLDPNRIMNPDKIFKIDPTDNVSGFTCTALASYAAYKYGQHEVLTHPPLNLFPKSSTTKLKSLDPPKYCNDISSVIPQIASLGILVVSSKPEIDHHTSNDFTTHKPLEGEVPQYIIYPKSTEEVSQVLKICNRERIPVVPFSGGSSIEGNFHSTRKGVVVNTSRMNQVLAVNDNDLDVVVQCG